MEGLNPLMMPGSPAALIAAVDVGDLIKALIPIAAVVFWILSQVLGNKEPGEEAVPKPRERRPPEPPDLEVESEIEAFLKRAARQQQRHQVGGDAAEGIEPQRRAAREGRPVSAISLELPVDAEIVDQPLSDQLDARHSVDRHVREHIGGEQLAEHAAHLGDEVGEADDRMEERLHEKFDHQLGRLKLSSTQTPYDTSGPGRARRIPSHSAAEIANMLARPGGIRQAIILNEILKRPVSPNE